MSESIAFRVASTMTVARSAPALEVDSLDAAVEALRRRGHRASSARRLVLEALFAADGPLTAEQIAAGLDGRLPRSDLASVYRNLDTLEQVGLVRHVHLGHAAGAYALASARAREYLVCERCGTTQEVDGAVLREAREAIRRATGWEAAFGHFPVVGACPGCAAHAATADGG